MKKIICNIQTIFEIRRISLIEYIFRSRNNYSIRLIIFKWESIAPIEILEKMGGLPEKTMDFKNLKFI